MAEDSHGYFWFLDAETARPNAAQHVWGPSSALQFYPTSDCTGVYYLQGPLPPPRIPFAYGDGLPWRVRHDAAIFVPIVYNSTRNRAGTCVGTIPGGIAALLLYEQDAPQDVALTMPDLGLTPPLHLERLP